MADEKLSPVVNSENMEDITDKELSNGKGDEE